jgi:hypothetical protein
MKQYFLLLLPLLCSVAGTAQFRNFYSDVSKQKIAVYVTDQHSVENTEFGNKLMAKIVAQGKYIAVERSEEFLAQIKKELAYQRSGYVDDKQISQLGKQFGVDVVCVVDIRRVRSSFSILVKLINVETAQIIATNTSYNKLRSLEDITDAAEKIAAELFGLRYRKEIKGLIVATEAVVTDEFRWGGHFTVGYRFNTNVALSIGGGYHLYSGTNYKGHAIPLFFDVRVNILRTMCSPYVAVAGGICSDTYTNTDTYVSAGGTIVKTSEHPVIYGFYSAAAGVHLQCTRVLAVYAGAGYNNIANAPAVNAGIAFTF